MSKDTVTGCPLKGAAGESSFPYLLISLAKNFTVRTSWLT